MADSVPYRYFVQYENGQPYYSVTASSNVPYGAQELSKADFVAAVNQQLEQEKNYPTAQQRSAQGLGSGRNFDQKQVDYYTSLLNDTNSGKYDGPSGLVMAKDPLTGQIVQRTTAEVAQDQANEQGVANGTLRQIAPGQYVPVGSAADQQAQGQQITATAPGANQPARIGGAAGSADLAANPNPTAPAPGTTGSTNTSTGTTTSTLPPELQDLKTQLQAYLDKLKANGQGINPNIQITPELAAQFLSQAQSEINPYYAGQLKLAREGLLSSVGYSKDQILQQEQNLQRTYGTNLRQLGESAADNGFALSGLRQRDEGNLATDTQNTIDQGRQALANTTGNAERSFAQQYGTSQLPSIDITGAPRVLAGQANFNQTGTSSPLYTLSPDVYNGLTGSQEYQQRADISNRTSQLEDAYRTQQSINQQRQLTI